MRGINLLDEHGDAALFGESGVMELYYYPDIRRFEDSFGTVIHDIFRLISPGQLLIFLQYKTPYIVRDRTNSFLVEMIYPDDEED